MLAIIPYFTILIPSKEFWKNIGFKDRYIVFPPELHDVPIFNKVSMKEIPGFEGLYNITRDGEVFSLHRGKIRKLKKNKANGYFYVVLCRLGKNKNKTIHRLIADVFIPNPDNKPQVNHINGNKTDNRVENLEWCTRSENILHSWKMGLSRMTEKHNLRSKPPGKGKFGENSNRAVCIEQYSKKGEYIKEWRSIIEASISLGINQSCLSQACRKRNKTCGGFIWEYSKIS